MSLEDHEYLEEETENYKAHVNVLGNFRLVRKSDGASIRIRDRDADMLRDEIRKARDTLARINRRWGRSKQWMVAHRNEALDLLFSKYHYYPDPKF
jgi:hypothetical protein